MAFGDNASQPAPMTANDQIRSPAPGAGVRRGAELRSRRLARAALTRLAPGYMRRRARDAAAAAAVEHLQSQLSRVHERHDEQIERLEDLVRELVLSSEALRQRIAHLEARSLEAPDRGQPEH